MLGKAPARIPNRGVQLQDAVAARASTLAQPASAPQYGWFGGPGRPPDIAPLLRFASADAALFQGTEA